MVCFIPAFVVADGIASVVGSTIAAAAGSCRTYCGRRIVAAAAVAYHNPLDFAIVPPHFQRQTHSHCSTVDFALDQSVAAANWHAFVDCTLAADNLDASFAYASAAD